MLKGNNNEEKIWNYLLDKIGNKYGVAGLMGNIRAESALSPTNVQNSYEKKLGMNDASYTAAVDNGTYKNFGSDAAGYGLCQWTSSGRKVNLLNYAKQKGKSIGDLEMQLEFLMVELNSSYKGVLTGLKNATSVRQASDVVLTKFERPRDQGEGVQKTRASYGQVYFDRYANGSTPVIHTTSTTTTQVTNKFSVGDMVVYTGTVHYTSSNSASPKTCKGGVAKVTAISTGKHKYHVVAVKDTGATVYGWVDEALLSNKTMKTTTGLNLRVAANQESKSLGIMKKGSKVYLIKKDSKVNWYNVYSEEFKKVGWCSGDYLT